MRDHMERRAAALQGKGLDAEEAKRQAALRFGNRTKLQEQSREIRLWAALESAWQDTRYAWRGMRKSPAFALTASLSLSLAIGANTAIYSIVSAAMLRPLPVYKPDQLFTLAMPPILQAGEEPGHEWEVFSYPVYQDFRAATGNSARLAMFGPPNRVEARGRDATSPTYKITTQYISADAFDVLGITPALGRFFSAEEDHIPGTRRLAILSYSYWQKHFNADPAILGRWIQIESDRYEVVGVTRKGFFGVEPGKFTDLWMPVSIYPHPKAFTQWGWLSFRILGRLTPGVTREQIAARLQPVFHEFQKKRVGTSPTMPESIRKQFLQASIRVNPGATGASDFRRTFEHPMWIVLAVSAGMLLIACANVASLLLARATIRSAELAMRISLGAGRTRLIRQLLTESLVLSLLAGAGGWLLARWAAPVLVSLLSRSSDPVQFDLQMNTRVLLFCVAVSTVAAMLFGLIPAWQSSSTQPMLALRSSSGQASKLRLGRFFVVVQVTCAFCLVMAGAAFLFSLHNLLDIDTGFDPRNVTVLTMMAANGKQQEKYQLQPMNQLLQRVAGQPGVKAVAIAGWPIFEGTGWSDQILLPGKAPSEREEIFYPVSSQYFTTLRTPLLRGRNFLPQDRGIAVPEPTVVNRAFTLRYFGNVSPIGQEFSRSGGKNAVRHIIVGEVANAYYGNLRNGPEPIVYVPMEDQEGFTLYLRSSLNLGSISRLVDREALAVSSDMKIREIATLETLVGNTLLREKLLAGIGGVLAFLGLLMAAIGLFGLLNYSVARRTKEIGIRAALGAQRSEIISLVMKDLFILLGVGLAVGLASSLAIMQLFRSFLFGIRPTDPVVMATAAGIFLLAACVAGGLPARRAASVDPLVALRHE
ncbi:MAG: ABC transporter permease [Acidobacteriaceae bacterium]|nr:ABC transporter permease [Acidobacteriaceae bacterium]